MYFNGNRGNQGSCFSIDSQSTITDLDSTYESNIGRQGGVIFAISESSFNFRNCQFLRNEAKDSGSILYALYNSEDRAL